MILYTNLHGSEDTGTGGGVRKADIKAGLEGAGAILNSLNLFNLTSDVGNANIAGVEAQPLQKTASQQETSAIASSIVGQANRKTITGQLMRIGSAEDKIANQARVDDLANDIAVGDAHNKTVLGGIVLVLVLLDQAAASAVVRQALAAATELDLVALEVSLVLHNLVEHH